jgi:hypothetical protein
MKHVVVIDFTNVKGNILLHAKNDIGKTSIIDIISIVLFSKSIKDGNKNDFINYNKYDAFIDATNMMSEISKMNQCILEFAYKHDATWNHLTSKWMKENNPFKGKTHTPEVIQKIKEVNSKPKSEEHKRKISETLKGNKPGNMRKVIVDGIEYESLSEGARQIGIPTSTIKNRLKSPKFDNYRYKN